MYCRLRPTTCSRMRSRTLRRGAVLNVFLIVLTATNPPPPSTLMLNSNTYQRQHWPYSCIVSNRCVYVNTVFTILLILAAHSFSLFSCPAQSHLRLFALLCLILMTLYSHSIKDSSSTCVVENPAAVLPRVHCMVVTYRQGSGLQCRISKNLFFFFLSLNTYLGSIPSKQVSWKSQEHDCACIAIMYLWFHVLRNANVFSVRQKKLKLHINSNILSCCAG